MTKSMTTRAHPLLGLDLDHGRLGAVVIRRSGSTLEIREQGGGPLAMDLLKNEPELVGREIRKVLDAAGVKERRCVVNLPASWVLALHTRVPDIEEGDVAEFLALEAERSFARDVSELVVASSRMSAGPGAKFATQFGVPREYVAKLEACLEAAGLKPEGFRPSLTALPEVVPADGSGQITILLHDQRAEVLVGAAGGIVALRVLDGLVDEEGGRRRWQAELLARELRITLRALPEELRSRLNTLRLTGKAPGGRELADELPAAVQSLGLRVAYEEFQGGSLHGLKLSSRPPMTPELALAGQYLAGMEGQLEFLPPRATWMQKWAARYSGKRLAGVGAAGAALLVLALVAFGAQYLQWQSLQSEWNAMKSRVGGIEETQTMIRKFRPWFSAQPDHLAVMKRLAESFPDEGSVSAKSIDIQNAQRVTVAGTAKDHASLLKTIEKLRGMKDVAQVQVGQIGGKAPMQFTFTFQWGEASTP